MDDPYATLGVQRDASVVDIRRAYRKLAVRFHPDRPSGDESVFRRLSSAYALLSDDDARRRYDRGVEPEPIPNYPEADITVKVEVDPKDLHAGAEKVVTVGRSRRCPVCRGGMLAAGIAAACVLCGGSGCSGCGYQGRVVNRHCAQCWGTGMDKELTTVTVKIPAGLKLGYRKLVVVRGDLWGRMRGKFIVRANVVYRTHRPGLIVR